MKNVADRWSWVNGLGVAILAACYLAALWNVARAQREQTTQQVVRLVHWQLEMGVRDGLAELIRRFEARQAAEGRPVRIIQIPIPENAYKQYVTTQLIGGTPPDMIQIGKFPEPFLGRYFRPLSRVLVEKNPFLAERHEQLRARPNRSPEEAYFESVYADLRDRPWMDTFTDGLQSMFRDSFQEYYGVGFSQFTIRMFYNKDLYRRILGTDEPPRTYRELLACCERIARYARENGLDLTPIASSRYQMEQFKGNYLGAATRDLAVAEDMNLDGYFTGEEKLMAILRGDAGPGNEQYRAGVEIGRRLAAYFPRGFMAADRKDAAFAFVQNRAVLITSGSWDAKGFLRQIQNQPPHLRFEVGILDLPAVDRDDPEFGRFYDGPASEATHGTQFPFGITRQSKNQDLCIQFLQFCTTPENNTVLNDAAGWIPAVVGARMSPVLEKFRPNYAGFWGMADFNIAVEGRAHMVESQEYWPYIQGQISYEAYASNLAAKVPAAAATDYERLRQGYLEGIPDRNAARSAYLALAVFGPPEERRDNETKLLRAWATLAAQENGARTLDLMMQITTNAIRRTGYRSEFNDRFFEELGKQTRKDRSPAPAETRP